MNTPLTILCALLGAVMIILAFPEGFATVLTVLVCSLVVVYIIRFQAPEDHDYLTRIFVLGLVARLSFGLLLHVFELRNFFGGDSTFYDVAGVRLVDLWLGNQVNEDYILTWKIYNAESGWGMFYLVGGIYAIIGRNIFAVQSFCAVIGAATVPLVYLCAYKIYGNRRVGRISALLVAFYPAFIIWSGQLLKDGLIIFLLVLSITMVLYLQEKFKLWIVVLMIFSLLGIITLRFYIFYMAALAIIGALVIGNNNSLQVTVKRMVMIAVVGICITYVAMPRRSGNDIEKFANLERIQTSRYDLARAAESGYGVDLDVSTPEGAFAALPLGLTYLLLAPFPWQMTNFRQAITLPEILVWWASIPFLLSGLWYTLKYRLRSSVPILIFSLMLTLAYGIFLGNVGTAYRQRTQIQVFLFMFIAVGWTMRQERSENERLSQKNKRKMFRERLQAKV